MDKYQHYEDASCGLLSGLQACAVTASKHLSEPIAVDPKNLQRQLEETKVRERDREGETEREKSERSNPSVALLKPICCPTLL